MNEDYDDHKMTKVFFNGAEKLGVISTRVNTHTHTQRHIAMVVPTGCGQKIQKKKNGTLNNARESARREGGKYER